MMRAEPNRAATLFLSACLLASPSSADPHPPHPAKATPQAAQSPRPASLVEQVMTAERAFAATMARRDLPGFVSFLSEEAIFFSGPGRPVLRGRAAIQQAWARFYEGPQAPFSWAPERVEVIDGGSLALSTGPVRDPSGASIATFNSIWRREGDGVWRILFDKGEATCPRCETATTASSAPPLAELEAYAQAALSAWRAPGLAMAIVQGGRVLLARGYGRRALGGDGAVDAHTRFAIASLTKGFTAALASQAVAAGTLAFDAPLSSRMPGFRLSDARVTAEVTLRDVLSHRVGLDESADLLWLGTGYDGAEILARLVAVPQVTPLRSRFSYSNVLYVAAGKLLSEASGLPFPQLLQERILRPAAMHDSGLGIPQAADGNVARPHAEHDGVLRVIAPRAVDNIAPAAAMYSSAQDLAQWLLLLLGRGELAGQRVLPAASVEAMLSPQMLVGLAPWQQELYPESHFLAQGLGFMLQDYRGQLVAWGTGGIDGYSCSLAVLPAVGLGIVVLANVPWTGLPEGLVFAGIDRLLGVRGRDYNALRLALSLQSRARHATALQTQHGVRVSSSWPQPPSRIIGRYRSPLFGDAEITQGSGQGEAATASSLLLRIGRAYQMVLEPWRPDALRARPFDRQLDPELCKLRVDADGTVRGFQLDDHGVFERITAAR